MQYLHKSMEDKVEFLPADKHKRFLQDESITLGVRTQTDQKYQKLVGYNIFSISQGKYEGWSLLINVERFFKLILSLKVYVARHAQIT